MRFLAMGLAAALALAAALPAGAEESLYERNYRALLATVPADAVLEVTRAEDGAWVQELWTAEQYASARAHAAAAMGRDYTEGPEGVPPPPGDHQFVGDFSMDAWGSCEVLFGAPRGLPATIPLDDKLWLYGGAWSSVVAMDCDDLCYQSWWGLVCSQFCAWVYPQACFEVGECFFLGNAVVFFLPPPFGAFGFFNGAASCNDPGT